jgi:hypothetical protein
MGKKWKHTPVDVDALPEQLREPWLEFSKVYDPAMKAMTAELQASLALADANQLPSKELFAAIRDCMRHAPHAETSVKALIAGKAWANPDEIERELEQARKACATFLSLTKESGDA